MLKKDLTTLLRAALFHPKNSDPVDVDTFIYDFSNLLPLLTSVFSADFLKINPLFTLVYATPSNAIAWTSFIDKFAYHSGEKYEELLKSGYEYYFSKMKDRKKSGVWYTPNPVVSYQCRGVDYLLEKNFNSSLGSQNVELLDPACGIGCYLSFCFRLVLAKNSDVAQNRYLEGHFKGIDIDLMACYLARLNMEYVYYKHFNTYKPYRGIRCGNALDRSLWEN